MKLFSALPDKDPLFAPLNDTNGNITGRYISFTADPANGTLTNYSLNVSGVSTPIFNSVVASNFKPTTSNVTGPLFKEVGDNMTMTAHNNPMGTFVARAADNASINLSMPAGFTAAAVTTSNESVKAWTITGNNITAVLAVKNGSVMTDLNSSASTAGFVNVSLASGGTLIFAALPVAGGFPVAQAQLLASQLANMSIEGATAIITTANYTLKYSSMMGPLVPSVNVSQGDVVVNLTPMSLTGAVSNIVSNNTNLSVGSMGNVSIGTNTTGQAGGQSWYVIAMDKDTLNPANGTPQVMVNGQSLSLATNPSALANSTSSFWMFQGTNASVFVVPLPGSNAPVSIEVKQGTQNAPSTTASVDAGAMAGYGIVIIGVVAVFGAAFYFGRQKK